MLFDLRGRGRRRTVKAIYLSLALLMGGGLVLFGIGGAGNGGLFDAFTSNDPGAGSANDVVEQRLQSAEKRVKAAPQDPAAWAALADVRFQVANNAENYNQAVGGYTESGKKELRDARFAWDKHVDLAGDRVNAELANKMAIALGPDGLQDYAGATSAIEAVIDAADKPTPAQYAQLAIYADLAGQSRKSKLAEEKAVALAPKDQKDQIKSQIALAKTQVQSAGTPEPTSTTGSLGG